MGWSSIFLPYYHQCLQIVITNSNYMKVKDFCTYVFFFSILLDAQNILPHSTRECRVTKRSPGAKEARTPKCCAFWGGVWRWAIAFINLAYDVVSTWQMRKFLCQLESWYKFNSLSSALAIKSCYSHLLSFANNWAWYKKLLPKEICSMGNVNQWNQ